MEKIAIKIRDVIKGGYIKFSTEISYR